MSEVAVLSKPRLSEVVQRDSGAEEPAHLAACAVCWPATLTGRQWGDLQAFRGLGIADKMLYRRNEMAVLKTNTCLERSRHGRYKHANAESIL